MTTRRTSGRHAQAAKSALTPAGNAARFLHSEIFSGMPVGVLVLNLEDPEDPRSFRIIDLNPAVASLTGATLDDLRGRTLAEFPKLLKTTMPNGCMQAFRERKQVNLGEITYGDDRIRQGIYLAQVFPLYDNFLGVAFEDVTARSRSEHASREGEERLRLLVESVREYAIFQLNPLGQIVSWNKGAQRLKGYTAEEVIGKQLSIFYPSEDVKSGKPARILAEAAQRGQCEDEGWRIRKDGSRFWASVVVTALRNSKGALQGFAKVTRDLTERRAIEDQIRQMQKMEAIGQLTGGIAHDFNNMLTVIGGNVETLQRRLTSGDKNWQRFVAAALRGVERAATLTHRLLAYARRQPLDPKPVELNRLIIGMSDLLGRTLGEHIKIETVLSAGLWQMSADPNQVENAVLNLAVNARDAMPEGGKLTLETANTYLDEAYAQAHAEVTAGQYVMLAVSDTGFGMTSEIVEKAFEPFFTTKELGEGTGLGLSQVYGFIKQSGGHVKIYSEPGEGTTIRLYFPRVKAQASAVEQDHAVQAPDIGGHETILVVEDDEDVRVYTTEILRELGYNVAEAADGDTALSLVASEAQIKLLFTDIGLPGPFNGRQLADEARKRRPDLKVLFTTGYARNAIIHHDRLDRGVQLIVKPFNYAGLAAKIRQIFDEDD